MGQLKHRLAIGLIGAFALQSLVRLALLVPLHGFERESVVVHALALASLVGLAGTGLVLARGRPAMQLVLAVVLGTVGVVSTIYDIIAAATGAMLHQAMSVAAIGSFYCAEQEVAACLGDYWHVTALVAAWALAWAVAIFVCADALAALVLHRLRGLAPRWLDTRLLLAGLVGAAVMCWIVIPREIRVGEPLYVFLTKRAFVQGPVELVSIPRPDYRPAPSPAVTPRTLILITVDSLRADAVQLQAQGDSLTPFLRELAQAGHLHDLGPATAICASSYCGITALQSSSDWATQQKGPPLVLPDVLAANGYRSIFLLSGPHRTSKNLGEIYGPNVAVVMDDASPDSAGLSDDREQVRRLRQVRIDEPDRTYLSIHLMSAHSGGRRFGEGSGLSADILDYTAYYRSGVRQADRIIRELFGVLEARGLLADAFVIITADHGERIGQGDDVGHNARIDRATASIPLLIYDARTSGWSPLPLVSQLDVAPTLVAAAGIGPPASWRGQALQHAVRRSAVPADSLERSAMVGMVNGRRMFFLCDVKTGTTQVQPMGGAGLTVAERTAALAQAPAMHAGLAIRRDAIRCFRPAATRLR